MAENRIIQNSRTTRRNVRVTEKYQTTDATPTVVYSIPLAAQRASFAQVRAIALKSDFSAMQAITIECGFRRASVGNIAKAVTGGDEGFGASTGDFAAPAPSISLVANTSTQAIDVQVTGKAATTIDWHVSIVSVQNLT